MQKRHTDSKLYFEELASTSEKYILPFIEELYPVSKQSNVLEIGCGQGGNLKPFANKGCKVVGVDICKEKIDCANEIFHENGRQENCTFIFADIFTINDLNHSFDLILIHDVIEHIEDKERFLLHVKKFLSPDGVIFIGFPAWFMPFGGHQQVCHSKIVSHFPFIHLLPKAIYRSILKSTRESEGGIEEMLYIKRCGINIEMFYQLVKRLNFRLEKEFLYFINPHYEIKFGLVPRKLYTWIGKIPYIRNFFCTSCFFLLKNKQ